MTELKSSSGVYLLVFDEKINKLIYIMSARQYRDFNKNFLAEYETEYGKTNYKFSFNPDQLISFKIFDIGEIKIRISIINETTVSVNFFSSKGAPLDVAVSKYEITRIGIDFLKMYMEKKETYHNLNRTNNFLNTFRRKRKYSDFDDNIDLSREIPRPYIGEERGEIGDKKDQKIPGFGKKERDEKVQRCGKKRYFTEDYIPKNYLPDYMILE